MSLLKIYHGSDVILDKPSLDQGKPHNDYGKGFYCTKDIEMAKEWACKKKCDGFVNEYELNTDDLKVLNLLDGNYTILNWIALLLNNRTFDINDEVGIYAKEYILDNFLIDLSKYDVVIGYRADDSYFSFAQSFIHNSLSIKSLSKALRLGALGTQVVLISNKAFERLKYINHKRVSMNDYYLKYSVRDLVARMKYNESIKKYKLNKDDLFIMDIIRGGIKNDDPRIQRYLC